MGNEGSVPASSRGRRRHHHSRPDDDSTQLDSPTSSSSPPVSPADTLDTGTASTSPPGNTTGPGALNIKTGEAAAALNKSARKLGKNLEDLYVKGKSAAATAAAQAAAAADAKGASAKGGGRSKRSGSAGSSGEGFDPGYLIDSMCGPMGFFGSPAPDKKGGGARKKGRDLRRDPSTSFQSYSDDEEYNDIMDEEDDSRLDDSRVFEDEDTLDSAGNEVSRGRSRTRPGEKSAAMSETSSYVSNALTDDYTAATEEVDSRDHHRDARGDRDGRHGKGRDKDKERDRDGRRGRRPSSGGSYSDEDDSTAFESTVVSESTSGQNVVTPSTSEAGAPAPNADAANAPTTEGAAGAVTGLSKPLASSFAKRCYFTKAGIGKTTQHYEGLTLTGNTVLMLAGAMKLKGCPTICDEDLRRVEQTYPNQFSRLPDELLLSSGWRRISKYCHFSNKPIPDGIPFFHSKDRCHPQGGYYFLLASAVGMVRPIDVEPLTHDTLAVLQTDFPIACDSAPAQLVEEPTSWTLVEKFCFFSGGPINSEEDVYYRADFDGNAIYMLAFLSPSLTPEELYRLGSDAGKEGNDSVGKDGNDGGAPLQSVAAVEEVESVYDLTDRDFDDLKLYHLGPCRALPPYILQPGAWTKVLPPHFLRARRLALDKARKYEEEHGIVGVLGGVGGAMGMGAGGVGMGAMGGGGMMGAPPVGDGVGVGMGGSVLAGQQPLPPGQVQSPGMGVDMEMGVNVGMGVPPPGQGPLPPVGASAAGIGPGGQQSDYVEFAPGQPSPSQPPFPPGGAAADSSRGGASPFPIPLPGEPGGEGGGYYGAAGGQQQQQQQAAAANAANAAGYMPPPSQQPPGGSSVGGPPGQGGGAFTSPQLQQQQQQQMQQQQGGPYGQGQAGGYGSGDIAYAQQRGPSPSPHNANVYSFYDPSAMSSGGRRMATESPVEMGQYGGSGVGGGGYGGGEGLPPLGGMGGGRGPTPPPHPPGMDASTDGGIGGGGGGSSSHRSDSSTPVRVARQLQREVEEEGHFVTNIGNDQPIDEAIATRAGVAHRPPGGRHDYMSSSEPPPPPPQAQQAGSQQARSNVSHRRGSVDPDSEFSTTPDRVDPPEDEPPSLGRKRLHLPDPAAQKLDDEDDVPEDELGVVGGGQGGGGRGEGPYYDGEDVGTGLLPSDPSYDKGYSPRGEPYDREYADEGEYPPSPPGGAGGNYDVDDDRRRNGHYYPPDGDALGGRGPYYEGSPEGGLSPRDDEGYGDYSPSQDDALSPRYTSDQRRHEDDDDEYYTSPDGPERRGPPINRGDSDDQEFSPIEKADLRRKYDVGSPGDSVGSPSYEDEDEAHRAASPAYTDATPASDYTGTSAAMRGAQLLLKKNRQRRLALRQNAKQDGTPDGDATASVRSSSSRGRIRYGRENMSPEEGKDDDTTWESETDVTSMVSGSSVWTENTNPADRSSRRALILQMAKARMKSGGADKSAKSTSGGDVDSQPGAVPEETSFASQSTGKMKGDDQPDQDEKKAEAVVDDTIDFTGDLD